jgi:hypothetical protein
MPISSYSVIYNKKIVKKTFGDRLDDKDIQLKRFGGISRSSNRIFPGGSAEEN